MKYKIGDEFLCRYGDGMIYPARCVQLESNKKSPRYFVHYNGWNARWDEWVEESRTLAKTTANEKLAESNNKSIKEKQKSAKKSGKRASVAPTPAAEPSATGSNKKASAVAGPSKKTSVKPEPKVEVNSYEPPRKVAKIDTGLAQLRANKQLPKRDANSSQQQAGNVRPKFREPPAGWKRGLESVKDVCRFSLFKHQAYFIGPGGTQKLMSPDEVHRFCDEIGRDYDVNEFDFTPVSQKGDITVDRASLILGQNRNRPPSATGGAAKKVSTAAVAASDTLVKKRTSTARVASVSIAKSAEQPKVSERPKRVEKAAPPPTKLPKLLPRKRSSLSAAATVQPKIKIVGSKGKSPLRRISVKPLKKKKTPKKPRIFLKSVTRPTKEMFDKAMKEAIKERAEKAVRRRSKKEVEEILEDVRKITGAEEKAEAMPVQTEMNVGQVIKEGQSVDDSQVAPVEPTSSNNQRPHRNRRPSKRFSEESESDTPHEISHSRASVSPSKPAQNESTDDTIGSTVAQVARMAVETRESPSKNRIKIAAEAKKKVADAAVEARRLSQSNSTVVSPNRKSSSVRRVNSESSLDEVYSGEREFSDGRDVLSDDSEGAPKRRLTVGRVGGMARRGSSVRQPKSRGYPSRPGPRYIWLPSGVTTKQHYAKELAASIGISPPKVRRRSGGNRRREMTPDDPMISATMAVPLSLMNDHQYCRGLVLSTEDTLVSTSNSKDFPNPPQQQSHSSGNLMPLMVSYTAGQPLQISNDQPSATHSNQLPYSSSERFGNNSEIVTTQPGSNRQNKSGVVVVTMNSGGQLQSASPQLLTSRGALLPTGSDDDYGGVGEISEFVASFNASEFGQFVPQSNVSRLNSKLTVVPSTSLHQTTTAAPQGNVVSVAGAIQKRQEEDSDDDDDGVKISFIDIKTGQLQTGSGRPILPKPKYQQPPPSTLSMVPRSVAIPPIVDMPANIFEGDDLATSGVEDEEKS